MLMWSEGRRCWHGLIWLAMFLSCMPLAVLAAPAAELSALDSAEPNLQIEALDSGGYRVQANIQIAADQAQVWGVLTDCGQALRYVPGMRVCQLLESSRDFDIARHRVRRSALLPSLEYRFRSDYFPYDRIVVHLLEGDLRRLDGEWHFASCGSACTVLSYDFNVEARWYVPASAERRALRDDVPEMLRRLKAQSEHWQSFGE